MDLETKPPATGSKNCGDCKSKRHKLQHCPIIKKCKHVAVQRFCFKCGVERPGHGSGLCPAPPSCSKCPGCHLSILYMDKAQDGRLTHLTIKSPTTKVTSLQPPLILLVMRDRILVKLVALIQTSLNQYPYCQPVCLPQKYKFC